MQARNCGLWGLRSGVRGHGVWGHGSEVRGQGSGVRGLEPNDKIFCTREYALDFYQPTDPKSVRTFSMATINN